MQRQRGRQHHLSLTDTMFCHPLDFVLDTTHIQRRIALLHAMRLARTISIFLLVALYTSQTYAQITATTGKCTGSLPCQLIRSPENDAARRIPALHPRRHLPLVKPIVCEPLVSIEDPITQRPLTGSPYHLDRTCPISLSAPLTLFGTRAPPLFRRILAPR